MTDVQAIHDQCRQRGITRLCHVTQTRNLPHILSSGSIQSARHLREQGLPINPNDKGRVDGYDDRISCTIEYPNVWFLNQAAARERLFQDWAVLEITPDSLWKSDTLFSPVNAAKGRGRYINSGPASFDALFDISPPGSPISRGMLHLNSCPTDNQAEVLVATPIPVESITGVVVPSEDAGRVERDRLRLLGLSFAHDAWRISPEMFDARRLAGCIQSGERVAEWDETANSPADRGFK